MGSVDIAAHQKSHRSRASGRTDVVIGLGIVHVLNSGYCVISTSVVVVMVIFEILPALFRLQLPYVLLFLFAFVVT